MKRFCIFILGIALAVTAQAAVGVATDDMEPILEAAKEEVSAQLADIGSDLRDAAKELASMDLKSDEAREILSGICEGRQYVYDCAIIDPTGKLSVVEPKDFQSYEGQDVSSESHVKKILETKQPLLSLAFECVEGGRKIAFEYPIINKNGEFLGVVSLLVNHDQLLKGIIEPLAEGAPCNIWVMQTDGLVIYDPDPNQINKNIFTDAMFKPFPELVAFAEKIVTEQGGSGSYEFYKKGYEDKTIVKKDAIWDTAGIYDSEWRIVAMEIEKSPAPVKPVN